MICEKCRKVHEGDFGSGRFCSRSCANSRNRTQETKDKISKSVNKWIFENEDKIKRGADLYNYIETETRICPVCNDSFDIKINLDKIYCTMKCNPNMGGYREGSGRGKSGWYKDYYCDSSWELAYVIYNLDHNIDFKRNTEKFSYMFENKKRNYIPDFIVNDEYVEIKGYKTEQWEEKLKQFTRPITVLYKDDMNMYIDYTISKYGQDYIKLYD